MKSGAMLGYIRKVATENARYERQVKNCQGNICAVHPYPSCSRVQVIVERPEKNIPEIGS